MTTTYAILATVALQHDYYADGRSADFEIVPSEETAAVLRGAAILTRTIGNVLVLLVKVDDAGAPYIELQERMRLSFYLKLSNPSFINITSIPYRYGSTYYLTNLHANTAAGTLYLNSPVPAFSNAASYAIGDLAEDGGTVYEAIKPMTPGSHAPGETDFWHQRPSAQYVHSGDSVLLSDGNLRLNVPAATVFNISVFGLNPATLAYDVPAGATQRQQFPVAQSELMINLGDLPKGRYRVLVNSQEQFVYIDETAAYARVYGIMELFHQFPAAHDFGWLDAANVPRAPEHVVQFANRLAIWKYVTRTTQVTGIEMTAVPNAFVAGTEPKEFLSALPLPLQQQPVKTLKVMKGATVLASRIANPPPDRISTCEDGGGNTYYCAEMHLNY